MPGGTTDRKNITTFNNDVVVASGYKISGANYTINATTGVFNHINVNTINIAVSGSWDPTGAETIQNKTISVNLNTLNHSSTNTSGDILVNNGTSFQRLAVGTSGQQLRVASGAAGLEWFTPPTATWSPSATETLTNKTINVVSNTLTSTSIAQGDLLKSDGVQFLRFAKGTSGQVIRVNSGASDLEWFSPGQYWSGGASETITNKTINVTDNTVVDTSIAIGDLMKSDGNKFKRFAMGTSNQFLQTNSAASDLTWTTISGTWNAAGTETVTNKTINTNDNTLSATSMVSGDILKANGTKFLRFAMGTAGQFLRVNAGGTDIEYATVNLSGAWDPNGIETITNKTVNTSGNVITSPSIATGDLMKASGTKYIRFPIGTSGQQLRVTSGAADLEWFTPTAGTWDPTASETLTNKTIDVRANIIKNAWLGASMVVYIDGSTYKAINTRTGVINATTSTTDAGSVINAAIQEIDGAGEGGTVFITRGTFVCTTTVNLAPASANVCRGVALRGDRFQTLLSFEPGSALTNGIVCTMSNGKISDLRVIVNANVTNAIKITGTASSGGDRGSMDFVELDGTNAHGSAAPVTNQVGILLDGATAAPYWWSFHAITMRSFDIGFKATGGDATSSNWTNSNFSMCTTGMYIDGIQHQGANLYFQGSSSYGEHGIEFTANADACMFTNIVAELAKTATNCEAVLFDSGADHNVALNVINTLEDGSQALTIRDNATANRNMYTYFNNFVPNMVFGGSRFATTNSAIMRMHGIGTNTASRFELVPTHTTVGDTSQRAGIRLFNSSDVTTDTEFLELKANGTNDYRLNVGQNAAGSLRSFGLQMNGTNILTMGTDNSLTIGRAITHKIGFYNTTPVVQAGFISSPSANTSQLKTAVDAIRTVLINLGLIAAS